MDNIGLVNKNLTWHACGPWLTPDRLEKLLRVLALAAPNVCALTLIQSASCYLGFSRNILSKVIHHWPSVQLIRWHAYADTAVPKVREATEPGNELLRHIETIGGGLGVVNALLEARTPL